METVVKDTHFFINMELGHHLPGIPYHSSSSCLRDDGGNLLPTLLSKTDHNGSMIFKLGDCASQR